MRTYRRACRWYSTTPLTDHHTIRDVHAGARHVA
jgi:hypothetical protein